MNSSVEQKLALSKADIGILLVLLGAFFSGLRPLFGRWLVEDGVIAVVTALYSFIASALLFLPYGLREVRRTRELWSLAVLALSSGLVIGIGGMAYFESLRRLPVTTVTLIFFTYPAMVIAAVAFLRRRFPRPPALLAIACVLVGCGLILQPQVQGAGSPAVDFAIAFTAPLSWTILILLLAGPLTGLDPWSRIGFVAGGSTLAMIAVMVAWKPPDIIPQSNFGWLGALGLVLLSGVLTHVLLTIGVPKAGPQRASIAGVFEVATSLAIGWVVLLEPISLRQIVGVCLILIAMLLSRRLEIA